MPDTPVEPEKRARLLRPIAFYKFCKALLSLVVGLGAIHLLRPGVTERAQEWVAGKASYIDPVQAQRLLLWLNGVTPRRIGTLGAGAFFFAALFAVEGVGLWRGKRWAEYVTVVSSLLLVPFEVVHLVRHPTLPSISALALNLLVAGYLIVTLRRSAPHHG